MNSFFEKKYKFSLLLFLFFLFFPQIIFSIEINYPKLPGADPPQVFLKNAPEEKIIYLYFLYIFNLAIWVSGIIFFGVLVSAGIRYLTAKGEPEKIIKARKQITDAFLGILILFSSTIFLEIINPQLLILEPTKLEPVEIIEKPETPAPPMKKYISSIDSETPLAQVIEKKVFGKELMTKIKNNATTTDKISQKLKDQVDDLVDEVKKCSCSQAKPKCKGTINIGGEGSKQECQSQQGQGCNVYCTDHCSSDVCANQRDDIEDLEKKNLEQIDKLQEEQKKTIQKIRILGEELSKLEIAENLMDVCPLFILESLGGFLSKISSFKETFKDEKWSLKKILVWDEISVIDPKEKVYDWATFYCPVGGTFREERLSPVVPSEEELLARGVQFEGLPEETLSLVCKSEVPVGEIIDRSKRTTNLLINKLEKLLTLQGKMIEEIDNMHVLISQCSSQMPMCCSFCFEVKIKKVRICIRQCIGDACPFDEINKKKKEIEEIQKQINNVVYGRGDKNKIGIVPIIDEVVSSILKDLNEIIRKEISTCLSETAKEELGFLGSCKKTITGIEPNKGCCDQEIKDFQDCLEKCYLEIGHKKYKNCLEKCLEEKPEPQKWCNHYINFYCCHPENF